MARLSDLNVELVAPEDKPRWVYYEPLLVTPDGDIAEVVQAVTEMGDIGIAGRPWATRKGNYCVVFARQGKYIANLDLVEVSCVIAPYTLAAKDLKLCHSEERTRT
jgi:hypothetical protein